MDRIIVTKAEDKLSTSRPLEWRVKGYRLNGEPNTTMTCPDGHIFTMTGFERKPNGDTLNPEPCRHCDFLEFLTLDGWAERVLTRRERIQAWGNRMRTRLWLLIYDKIYTKLKHGGLVSRGFSGMLDRLE